MKRIFSRKRKDYVLFAAALAFGFTATSAALLLHTSSNQAAPDAAETNIVRETASTSKQTNTITFAYAPNAERQSLAPAKAELLRPQPVVANRSLRPSPAPRQHYLTHQSSSAQTSITEVVSISKGDTLDRVFEAFDIPKNISIEAVNSLKGIFSPRQFRIGQQITLLFTPQEDGSRTFRGYRFAADPLRDVIVMDDAGKGIFDATVVEKELKTTITAKKGNIMGSLVGATNRAGIPYSIVSEMIRVYSYSIDFQRDIHEGDHFEVLYESKTDDSGRVLSTGNLLYANLVLSDKEYPVYRHEDAHGHADFYKADGTSNRRGLIRTPVDGARMSSGFGMRRHPVLGYSKMHKGVDFAAPTGTPIYAAGDGTVKQAGWANGYGRFIKLSHNAGIQTAYGHMSRIATGIRPGVRVKQGQVIGYVGATGRATGPHLHYEVIMNGAQVNPVGVKVPTNNQLAGADLKKFKATVISSRNTVFKQALAAQRVKTASR